MRTITRREFLAMAAAAGSACIFRGHDTARFPEEDMIGRARRELKQKGITREQSSGHSIFSELAYSTITPFMYELDFHLTNIEEGFRKYSSCAREATWKMYLGIPLPAEERKYFDISEHRPPKERNPQPYYYSLPQNESRIRRIYERYKRSGLLNVRQAAEISYYEEGLEIHQNTAERIIAFDDPLHNIMGKFSITEGEDERGKYISYWDRWDLEPEILGFQVPVKLFIGKPFEIYNRLYLDETTSNTPRSRK